MRNENEKETEGGGRREGLELERDRSGGRKIRINSSKRREVGAIKRREEKKRRKRYQSQWGKNKDCKNEIY